MTTAATRQYDAWNRCDVCGKFIKMDDFGNGAVRSLVYPDSHRSEETWETLCKVHATETVRPKP